MARLSKLAKKAKTFDLFLKSAVEWVKWYGFPGKGTKADYLAFWFKHKGV